MSDLNNIVGNRTLDDLGSGESAIIHDVTAKPALGRRLLEMGLTSGANLSLVRRAPSGDPVEIMVRGYHLTLRRSEARSVLLRG